jgi:hypothetical protein
VDFSVGFFSGSIPWSPQQNHVHPLILKPSKVTPQNISLISEELGLEYMGSCDEINGGFHFTKRDFIGFTPEKHIENM